MTQIHVTTPFKKKIRQVSTLGTIAKSVQLPTQNYILYVKSPDQNKTYRLSIKYELISPLLVTTTSIQRKYSLTLYKSK